MSKNGFSVIELLIVFTAITLIGLVASVSYSGYVKTTERKLHLINSQRLVHMVQNGFVEGWVQRPNVDNYIQVSLDLLDSHHLSELIDPSSETHASYGNSSFIHVYNNTNNILEYYIRLVSLDESHTYVDTLDGLSKRGTTQIKDLTTEDILLRD